MDQTSSRSGLFTVATLAPMVVKIVFAEQIQIKLLNTLGYEKKSYARKHATQHRNEVCRRLREIIEFLDLKH